MSKTEAKKWTRGEKAILWSTAVVVILAAIVTMWWNKIDADPVVHVPTPVMPIPNGYNVLSAASKGGSEAWPMFAQYTPGASGPPPKPDLSDPKVMAAAEALVKLNQPTVDALHAGLSYPFATPPVRSFNQLAPWVRFRHMARVGAFTAKVECARGDHGEAIDGSLDILRLANDLPRGGNIIAFLVGNAIDAIGRKPLWSTVENANAVQSKHAVAALEEIDNSRVPFDQILQEEEWSEEASLVQIFHQKGWKQGLIDATQTQTGSGLQKFQQDLRYSVIGKRQILNDYIAGMNADIAAVRGPYNTKPACTQSDLIADMLVFEFPTLRFRFAYTQTETRLLMTAFALRAYKLDHGAYPSTLQTLVPSYLHAVPIDPFSPAGDTLRYRLQGSTYILYSIGPDMNDDGGVAFVDRRDPKNLIYYPQVDSKGDIVAGVNQ